MTNNEATPIADAKYVIDALRSSGYRDTAMALAELIDNSIQSGIEPPKSGGGRSKSSEGDRPVKVNVLLGEKHGINPKNNHSFTRLSRIAVLDDAFGMGPEILRECLSIGKGSRLNATKGMGRFGVGLPLASLSQCSRVEVWSWQDGIDSAQYVYLDVDEVKDGSLSNLDEPRAVRPPAELLKMSEGDFSKSGTLVVWSKLDQKRISWKTGRATVTNCERIIGRVYRKFIHDGRAQIRCVIFNEKIPSEHTVTMMKPNDPLYLMAPSTTPAPYDETPMFEPLGESGQQIVTVRYGDIDHAVTLRWSMAKAEVQRPVEGGQAAGNKAYGQHAKGNVGVSILRENREIEMNDLLVVQGDPRNRWWGAEMDFPASLDSLMQTNVNKQAVPGFINALRKYLEVHDPGSDQTYQEFLEHAEADGDPQGELLKLITSLNGPIRSMFNTIRITNGNTSGARKAGRHAEVVATDAVIERIEKGEGSAESDKEFTSSEADQATVIKGVTDCLVDGGVPPEKAKGDAEDMWKRRLRFLFVPAHLDSTAFFGVHPELGRMIVKVNIDHPLYARLWEVIDQGIETDLSSAEAQARLSKASEALKLLFFAWARYEDEAQGEVRRNIQEARADWGRVVSRFLTQNQNE